jgi:hypothetical protein
VSSRELFPLELQFFVFFVFFVVASSREVAVLPQ